MKNDYFYKATITIIAALLSISGTTQDKTTVRASVNRSQILIGEPIKLTLEADIPEHEPIRFFQLDSIPHFEFLNIQRIDTANTGSGTNLSQVIQITSFDSGQWVIPAFSLGEDIATDTIPIDVGFSAFNPDQPYHDVKDIIEVNPKEEKKGINWWYIVAAAAVLLLIILLVITRKKKPVVQLAAPPPDPYKTAMEQLDLLQREKPAAKQYYSRLVDIFRIYVAERKGIHSLQATTDDLVLQLKNLGMEKQQFDQLAGTLRQTDYVKYAKYIPTSDDDRLAFALITRSIQQIEQMQ